MKGKPLYLLVILLAAMCSCGSSRKVQKQTEVVRIETITKSTDSLSLVKGYLITETDTSAEELEITITEYDTAMPVDSATEKPPVKKEVKVSRKKGNRKQSERKQEERKEAKSELYRQTDINDSIAIESTRHRTETTVPKQIGDMVKSVCVLIGLIIVLYIVRRFGKR